MRKFAIVGLLALAAIIPGCGNNQVNNVAVNTGSGTWEATLTDGLGNASALNFLTTFTVNSDNSLSVTFVGFLNENSCFLSETASGNAELSTTGTNVVVGTVNYTINSTSPTGNSLVLTGQENGTSITGSWTLTGASGCAGSGNFTMTKSN
jgi:hypothetical protein